MKIIFNIKQIFIFTLTEYARARVTANGRPSGTATTNTVTPMMTYFTR